MVAVAITCLAKHVASISLFVRFVKKYFAFNSPAADSAPSNRKQLTLGTLLRSAIARRSPRQPILEKYMESARGEDRDPNYR